MNRTEPRIAKKIPGNLKNKRRKIKYGQSWKLRRQKRRRRRKVGTVSSVIADLIDGHEDAGDDGHSSKDEERDSKGDLFDGRAIIMLGIRRKIVHH